MRINIRKLIIICIGLLLTSTAVIAEETRWITDKLRLSVYEALTPGSNKIATLLSGDRLTVLSKDGQYSKVKTTTGVTGWVKTAYLDKEVPARLQLASVKKKNASLAEKLAANEQLLKRMKSASRDSVKQREKWQQRFSSFEQQLANAGTETRELKAKLDAYKGSLPLSWVFPLIIISILASTLGGYLWSDYRARKRHGGFRL